MPRLKPASSELDEAVLCREEEEAPHRMVVELVFRQRDSEAVTHPREDQLAQNSAVLLLPRTVEFPDQSLAVDCEDVAELVA